jgi:NADH-quinone oxidoreductase subunit H
MAGWGSDNKYALLGGVRAAAQLISYEIPLVMALLAVAMLPQSLNLAEIVGAQADTPYIVYQTLAFLIFVIAGTAELYRPRSTSRWRSQSRRRTNRGVLGHSLVDVPARRVREHGLISILGSLSSSVAGTGRGAFSESVPAAAQVVMMAVKTSAFIIFFMWIRGSLPRLRIDQMMSFCWQILLPFAFLQIMINGLVLVYDWPNETLILLSGAAAAGAVYMTYRAARLSGVRYQPGYQRVGSVL